MNRDTLSGERDGEATKCPTVSLADFQQLIRRMYFRKDAERGVEGTFMWLMEEVGELASALRHGGGRSGGRR